MLMNPWTYRNKPVTSPPVDSIGFVYLITSLIDGPCLCRQKEPHIHQENQRQGKSQTDHK